MRLSVGCCENGFHAMCRAFHPDPEFCECNCHPSKKGCEQWLCGCNERDLEKFPIIPWNPSGEVFEILE